MLSPFPAFASGVMGKSDKKEKDKDKKKSKGKVSRGSKVKDKKKEKSSKSSRSSSSSSDDQETALCHAVAASFGLTLGERIDRGMRRFCFQSQRCWDLIIFYFI